MANSSAYAHWSLEPYCIGMKLRSLRNQKRLTLSRLAVETDLSTALLSKLETDRMVPTLPTLANICRVYGVGLSHFFTEATEHTLSITRKQHLLATGRGQESVKHTALNAATAESKLQVEMVEFPSGGAASVSEMNRQVACLMYVIEGRLKLDVGGSKEVLEAGDCVYLDSQMTMSCNADGKSSCRVLLVMPGANLLERA